MVVLALASVAVFFVFASWALCASQYAWISASLTVAFLVTTWRPPGTTASGCGSSA